MLYCMSTSMLKGDLGMTLRQYRGRYCDVFIEKCVYTKFHSCVSELHAHLCPYHNV